MWCPKRWLICLGLGVQILLCDIALSWWRHQMETFSALLALCAGNSPVPVNSPHKGQWHGALMFSLIYAWINDWINNREAGDLRRQCGHYDVSVMYRVYSKNYASASPLIVCWSGLIRDDFTHIREGYFTATGAFIRLSHCLLYRGKMSTWNNKTTLNWYEHHNQTTHTTKASAFSMRYTVLKCWPCSDVWLKFSTYFSF